MATTPAASEIPESEASRMIREANERRNPPVESSKPEAPPQERIVEKIVQVYPDDVKTVIEKARQEEKEKLYDRIRGAKAVESENAALKIAMDKLEKESANLVKKIEDMSKKTSKPGDSGQVDTQVIIDETAKLVSQQMQANFKAERDQLVNQINTLSNQLTATSLSSLREKLVAEANGKIIPELVRGDTEENLRTSVIEARRAYEKIVSQVGGNLPKPNASAAESAPSAAVPAANATMQPAAPTMVEPGPTAFTTGDNSGADQAEQFGKEVKSMSREDYAKIRKGILSKIKTIYKPEENAFVGR